MSDIAGLDWNGLFERLGAVGTVAGGAAYVIRQLYTEKRADRAAYDLELKSQRAAYDAEVKAMRAEHDLELKNLQALYNQKNDTYATKLEDQNKAQAAMLTEMARRLRPPAKGADE